MLNSIDFYKGIFLHVIPVCIIVPSQCQLKCQSCQNRETSQLICRTNQLTGFYMMATLAFNLWYLMSWQYDKSLPCSPVLNTTRKTFSMNFAWCIIKGQPYLRIAKLVTTFVSWTNGSTQSNTHDFSATTLSLIETGEISAMILIKVSTATVLWLEGVSELKYKSMTWWNLNSI